jgi:hypothetical protein
MYFLSSLAVVLLVVRRTMRSCAEHREGGGEAWVYGSVLHGEVGTKSKQ